MQTFIQKTIFFICYFLLVSFAHASDTNDSSVEAFVAKQQIIRTYEDNTPNFGDLATTLSTMDRLRQMGFKGVFEFIYSARTQKVPTLFHLPKNIPEDYFDKEKNIRFITFAKYYKQWNNNAVKPIELAVVSGGFSLGDIIKGEVNSLATEQAKPVEITWDEFQFPYNNNANMLKVKVSLELTVWMEKGCSEVDSGNATTISLENQEESIPLCDGSRQFLVAPFATFADAKAYVQSNPEGQQLLKEKPALATLMTLMENESVNILPSYGWPLVEDYDGHHLQTMLGIIAGARYAQLNGKDLNSKPLIIAVFKDYAEIANEVYQMINNKNWAQYSFPWKENAKKMIESLKVANIFDVADITKPETTQKLLNLQPNQILVLSIGPLPKVVFDGLYNHTGSNMWPAIREGENTKNSLLLTGKPHIRIVDEADAKWEPTEAGFGPDRFDESQSLSKKHNGLVFSYDTFWVKQQPAEMLGNYIIDAKNPTSMLSQYFEWLKVQALKPENDRIYAGLKAVMEMLSNDMIPQNHLLAKRVSTKHIQQIRKKRKERMVRSVTTN